MNLSVLHDVEQPNSFSAYMFTTTYYKAQQILIENIWQQYVQEYYV